MGRFWTFEAIKTAFEPKYGCFGMLEHVLIRPKIGGLTVEDNRQKYPPYGYTHFDVFGIFTFTFACPMILAESLLWCA